LTDADLRAYLLRQTTEADAERVEVRALDDDDFFATLESVEDDLFDDYVRGRMADDERPLFLAKYGAERARLQVARALMMRTAEPHVVSAPAMSRYWMIGVAAALVVGIGLTLRVRRTPAPDRAAVPVAVSTPAVPASAPVALLLTLSTSRSAAGQTPQVALPMSAATLQLRVRLDPADAFDSYVMELRSDRDLVVWRAGDLHASAAAGDLTLAGDVPAAMLKAAVYELTVLGSAAGRTPEPLGFAAVKIAR
jgi:hypothetical protein